MLRAVLEANARGTTMPTPPRRRRYRKIKLLSNQYWGRKSGTITKSGECIFKIKKWAGGANNGKLPSRKARSYKNAKLTRLSVLRVRCATSRRAARAASVRDGRDEVQGREEGRHPVG